MRVQKYLSLTNHIYDAMPLVCNLEFFNSLPQAYQKVVQAGRYLRTGIQPLLQPRA